MLIQSPKKYLTNPMIALLSVVVYVVLWRNLLSIPYAMGVGLLLTLFLEAILRKTFQSRVYSLPYYMLIVVFVSKILLWIFGHKYIENEYAYFLIGEIFMILQLIGLKAGRAFINTHFFKERSFLAKALLNDYFMTLVMFKYVLLIHVLFLLLYKEIMNGHIPEQLDYIAHIGIPIFAIVFFLIYQFFRTRYLVNKLQVEEWLPIVNEEGEVKGRIARSVSQGFNFIVTSIV